MIEMAVVFPVLFAIGLGVIEFGNLFYNYHLIANGVRDAARYASGRPHDCDCDADIKNIAMTGTLSGGSNRVSWWDDPDSQVDVVYASEENVADEYRGGDFIYKVTVTATVPYDSLGFLGYFALNEPTLTFSHEERVIGVR